MSRHWVLWFYLEINMLKCEISFLIEKVNLGAIWSWEFMLSMLTSYKFYYISICMDIKEKGLSYTKITVICILIYCLFLTLVSLFASLCLSFLTKTVEIHAFLSVSQAVDMRNSWSFHIKKTHRTSLEIQWLKLHVSTAGGMGLIPGLETKIPHATTQPK